MKTLNCLRIGKGSKRKGIADTHISTQIDGLHTESVGGSARRQSKQVRGTDDPRDLLPCYLTEQTFLLKFPFVKVIRGMHYLEGYMDGKDKCGDNHLMDYETIKAFVKYFGASLQSLLHTFTTEGQLHTRPIHCGLLHEIRMLVEAHMDMKAESNDKDKSAVERKKEIDRTEMAGMILDTMRVEDEDIEDDQGAEEVVSNSSRHDVDISHEARATSGFSDFLIKGFDKAYMAKCGLLEDANALCTYMVLDAQGHDMEKFWREGPGGVFQAAAYGVFEALNNAKKGRRSPIHLKGWSKDRWTYGLLEIEDVVQIKDGKVIGSPTLQNDLKDREAELQSRLLDMDAIYSPGDYLVGKLYISDEFLSFPSKSLTTRDTYRFFESLLRICLGDTVLRWKLEDAKRLFQAVAEIKREAEGEIDEEAPSERAYEAFRRNKRLRHRNFGRYGFNG